MDSKGKRNSAIDIIKAIFILSVVVYHLVYRPQGSMPDRIIRELIYLSLGGFFFLSGYFYRRDKAPLKKTIGHRMTSLLKPAVLTTAGLLFVFGPYQMIVRGYTFSDWLWDGVLNYLRPEFVSWFAPDHAVGGQLYENLSAVWFVWTLAWSSLLFYIIMHFCDNPKKTAVALVVTIGIGSVLYVHAPNLPWSLQLTPLYSGIMMLGSICGRMKIVERLCEFNIWISTILAVPLAYMHFIIFDNFGSDLIYLGVLGNKTYVGAALFIVQLIIGLYVVHVIARFLQKVPVVNIALEWVGRNTMTILLWHCTIGGLAADALHTYNKPGVNWYLNPLPAEVVVKSFATFLIGLAGCVFVVFLTNRIKANLLKADS
jgi:fucose 4-O-acetylase-like acetyltransferase